MAFSELSRLTRVIVASDPDFGTQLVDDCSLSISSYNVANTANPERITSLQSEGVETIPSPQGFNLTIPNGQFYEGDSAQSVRTVVENPNAYPWVLVQENYNMGYMGRFTASLPRQIPTAGVVSMGVTLGASNVWLAGPTTLNEIDAAAVAGDIVSSDIMVEAGDQIYLIAAPADDTDDDNDFVVGVYAYGEVLENSDTTEYVYQSTADDTAPTTPTGGATMDDFVPTGWSASAPDPTSTNPFVWRSTRTQTGGAWADGDFAAPEMFSTAEFETFDNTLGVNEWPNRTVIGLLQIEADGNNTGDITFFAFAGNEMNPGN